MSFDLEQPIRETMKSRSYVCGEPITTTRTVDNKQGVVGVQKCNPATASLPQYILSAQNQVPVDAQELARTAYPLTYAYYITLT